MPPGHRGLVAVKNSLSTLVLQRQIRKIRGRITVRYRTVMGLFVVTIRCEGVGYTGELGLNHLLIDGIIKALKSWVQEHLLNGLHSQDLTGPVSTFPELVDQVPTNSVTPWAVVVVYSKRVAPKIEATAGRMFASIV